MNCFGETNLFRGELFFSGGTNSKTKTTRRRNMNKRHTLNLTFGFLAVLLTTTASASPSYFNAVTNLHPVSNWSMHVEVGSPTTRTAHISKKDSDAKHNDDRSVLNPQHGKVKVIGLTDAAFRYGYTANLVNVNIGDMQMPTLSINDNGKSYNDQNVYSVWTRDLYWGFLGWAQAGDDSVLKVMRSSIRLLIMAKNKNQALGQNKTWPLNDHRFYIPQAYCFKGNAKGLWIATNFFPWDSESQADFLLLTYNYWKLSGDRKFIESIWSNVVYVTGTLELLDTNGDSLPNAVQGSYDYQWVVNAEEPLMCAKASLAYSSVAKLARMMGQNSYAHHLDILAAQIKRSMNQDVKKGGLWDSAAGHYVNMRKFSKDGQKVDDTFIPYENLVPMWCGMTSDKQNSAIFARLDAHFDKYYNLRYGPEYCAPAAHNDQSVMDSSSVTWLGFLDVYLRGKEGHDTNRSRIFDLLMRHAGDAHGIPFPEGAGIYGSLTGNGGRTWDNGNFFHLLICGIFRLEKSQDGITIVAPDPIAAVPLTELTNVRWRQATFNFKWSGTGEHIKGVTVDGEEVTSDSGVYRVAERIGTHRVTITLH
jgi:hypothetical protein